ncbi:MAG: glutamine synthetase type III, partial [Oscillospiraceae bacterium]|nr:glutamine synthetase type III [Oscillospiraceae bacterium]
KKQILPAGIAYARSLAETVAVKAGIGVDAELEKSICKKVSEINASLSAAIAYLDKAVINACEKSDVYECAKYYRDVIFTLMSNMRALADELEMIVPENMWPFPTYGDLLFRV